MRPPYTIHFHINHSFTGIFKTTRIIKTYKVPICFVVLAFHSHSLLGILS